VGIDDRAIEYEEATIRAFVLRDKQERFLSFVRNVKKRKKFTEKLADFSWFDQRFVTSVPWRVDPSLSLWERHTQGLANISRMLKSKGAGRTCWVISASAEIDGRELDLESALEKVVGSGIGAILSCVPGKLAYFEGENQALLLAK
jgi:hypothetical protein